MDRPVAVVGLMGAGKTTLATALSARLGLPLHDSDAQIEAATGRTAREIAHEDGPAALHALEREVFLAAVRGGPCVAAAAASTVDDPRTLAAIRQAVVVWIDGDVHLLARRFDSRPGRPDYGTALEVLTRQSSQRRASFERIADVVVDAATPTAAQTDQVIAAVAVLVVAR